jgi:hypothetical protein
VLNREKRPSQLRHFGDIRRVYPAPKRKPLAESLMLPIEGSSPTSHARRWCKNSGEAETWPTPQTAEADCAAPTSLRLFTPNDPGLVSDLPAEPLIAAFRQPLESMVPTEQELGKWYHAIADAIELGDAVRTGYCALYAMHEINSLVERHVKPLYEASTFCTEDRRNGRGYQEGSGAVRCDEDAQR